MLSVATETRQRQVFDRVLYTLRQLRKPIIAAVHGMAYGGGCEIAISTDFIIASDDSAFSQPEAIVGLSAGGGAPVFLRPVWLIRHGIAWHSRKP